MAYTLDFSLALGGTKTGLTMAAQLVDTDGNDSGSEITTGFSERGNGFYLWHYASFPDGFRGGVEFYEDGTPDTILAFASINPEEAEYTDQQLTTLFTTALTESYAADGATVTVAQALYEIMQFHNERSVSSTTVTVKKRDGSTTAYTLTLSDATEPTSITRAT